MASISQNRYRSHSCGELRSSDIDKQVRLCGWVRSYRDHGGVVFVDLRDRFGVTQVLFDPTDDEAMHRLARGLRNEWVISVAGRVRSRPEDMFNPKLPTGEIEVVAGELEVLNRSDTVPFEPDTMQKVAEETRLKYRFIDLRRPAMTESMIMRHRITKCVRDYYDEHGFLEVETPFLTRSTPEGARDFLTPSRLTPGTFYALPQSPQLFKQMLMVSGLDRYVQVVRCFRDEDLRADRQPEFTQIDVEMSFVTRQDVMRINEGAMRRVAELCDAPMPDEIPVIPYSQAMAEYGIDRPDMRFDLRHKIITDLVADSEFKVFASVAAAGGMVKGLTAPGGAEFTRKYLDDMVAYAQSLGAKGMAWSKVAADGSLNGPVSKFFTGEKAEALKNAMDAGPGDCMVFIADTEELAHKVLAAIRSRLGADMKLYGERDFAWCWVVDFPLLMWNADEKRWDACHHPFTAPAPEDMDKLSTDPGKVRSDAYDFVLNGVELGGGSIRIHDQEIQKKVFAALNIGPEEARAKFGFLLDALRFGAPPHGGIAFGLDRVVMMMLGRDNLREVIAFPKTSSGTCMLTEAPSTVDDRQLRELFIQLDLPEDEAPTEEAPKA